MKKFKKLIPILTFFFICLVGYLLYNNLKAIEWDKVGQALSDLKTRVILVAGAMSMVNYFILTSYDLLAFRFLKLKNLAAVKILFSAFICYVFNLNLGALVGGMALRYRLYSGWHVPKGKITAIMFFSTMTNWLGYIFLLSLLMAFNHEKVKSLVALPSWSVYLLACVGLVIIFTYFWMCFKGLKIKSFKFPSLRVAFLQLALSCVQWLLLSMIIRYLLIQIGAKVDFVKVLFTYLMAGIAGVITHIPGGLGVLEATFLRMNTSISSSDLIVALISFRAIYYLAPLGLALPLYAFTEYFQKKHA